jgi:predicted component of type VI protein secretion system
MSATTHLAHLVPAHARREGYFIRLRVRARRVGLDRRLAAGEDPRADVDLRLRADQLTESQSRDRIALVIERTMAEAAGPPAPFSSQVPLARTAIVACTPRLRAIAGRLRSDHVVAAKGVAQAAMLVREGAGPLYSTSTSEDALRPRLAEVAGALEGA